MKEQLAPVDVVDGVHHLERVARRGADGARCVGAGEQEDVAHVGRAGHLEWHLLQQRALEEMHRLREQASQVARVTRRVPVEPVEAQQRVDLCVRRELEPVPIDHRVAREHVPDHLEIPGTHSQSVEPTTERFGHGGGTFVEAIRDDFHGPGLR